MLKVFIYDEPEIFYALHKKINWKKQGCEIFEPEVKIVNIVDFVIKNNIDVLIASGEKMSEKSVKDLVNNAPYLSLLVMGEVDNGNYSPEKDGITVIKKRFATDDIAIITECLKSAVRKKDELSFVARILVEKKFEEDSLRAMMKNEAEFFTEIFRELKSKEIGGGNLVLVCLKLINVLYDYLEKLGFKNAKKQREGADTIILSMNSAKRVLEYTEERYNNFLRFDEGRKTDYYNSITESIRESVHNNYSHSDFGVQKIAEIFKFSPNYINDIFKQHAGISIPKYLTSVRLEASKKLLEETDLPINDIALDVGYTRVNYFSRVFKKEFGMSPIDYRNRKGKTKKKKGERK